MAVRRFKLFLGLVDCDVWVVLRCIQFLWLEKRLWFCSVDRRIWNSFLLFSSALSSLVGSRRGSVGKRWCHVFKGTNKDIWNEAWSVWIRSDQPTSTRVCSVKVQNRRLFHVSGVAALRSDLRQVRAGSGLTVDSRVSSLQRFVGQVWVYREMELFFMCLLFILWCWWIIEVIRFSGAESIMGDSSLMEAEEFVQTTSLWRATLQQLLQITQISDVEPAPCYQKVAGLIPLVCMLKCPWARCWTTNCSWCADWQLAWQTPPSVWMYELL